MSDNIYDNTVSNTDLVKMIKDGKDAAGKALATLKMRVERGGKKAKRKLDMALAHISIKSAAEG